MAIRHAGRVINGNKELVLTLAGFGAAQPYAILAELACNISHNLAHVQSLASSIVTSVNPHRHEKNNKKTKRA